VKVYIRSIAVALAISLTPLTNAAAIPDFTDPTLPTIVSFSQWIDISNKGEITFVTETSLRWKKNRPTIFAGSMGILENKNGELAQPCYAIGNVDNGFGSVRKLGGNSIEITADQILKETVDGDFKVTTYLFSQNLAEPVKSPHTPFEWNYCRGVHRPSTIGIYDETGRIKTFFDERFNSEKRPGVTVSQDSFFWNENPKFYPCPPANPALQEGYHTARSICDSINPFVSGITVSDSLFIQANAAREKFIAEEDLKKAAAEKAAAEKAAAEKAAADARTAFEKAAIENSIRDKAAVEKAARDKTAASKKVTITCVKGKLTKKVTAIMPKCPTGYKKK
jgi:hypothetical protein